MKHILVTGGAGFIGSHLCRALVAQGHRVSILDNFFTGDRRNIADLIHKPNVAVIEHDIINPLASPPAADQIYNLACPASPVHYQLDPVKTVLSNVMGTIHMLELARKTGARILQASTSEVYGNPQVHPQPETYHGDVNPIGPRACYDEGKRCAETLFFDYHRQYGVDIKVVRIFNTYGPAMCRDDGRVVSNFIYQAIENKPLTIYGDGSQTRSFCYIDDMVAGLIAMMESPVNVRGPINLGNPDEFTIEELADHIVELTGSASEVAYKPLPQDDPMQRRPDITLAKELLNWEPKVNLDKGLAKTVAAFKKTSQAA